jgi:hypothetical protein
MKASFLSIDFLFILCANNALLSVSVDLMIAVDLIIAVDLMIAVDPVDIAAQREQ